MKSSGEMRDRRTITLTDDSGLSLMATFWGDVAQMDGLEIGNILAIKGAKVSEYGGKSLNVSSDSTLELNPDEEPRYHELY